MGACLVRLPTEGFGVLSKQRSGKALLWDSASAATSRLSGSHARADLQAMYPDSTGGSRSEFEPLNLEACAS